MIDWRSLNLFDWLLVAIVVYSTVGAFVRGFFREVFSLLGLILGMLLASWNYAALAGRLVKWLPHSWRVSWAVADIVSFLMIALGVMMIAGLAGKLLRRTARTIGLGFIDRMLGAVFGMGRGLLLGVLVMMAAAAFLPGARYVRDSQLSSYFLVGAHAVSFVVPSHLQGRIRAGALELRHSSTDWIKPQR